MGVGETLRQLTPGQALVFSVAVITLLVLPVSGEVLIMAPVIMAFMIIGFLYFKLLQRFRYSAFGLSQLPGMACWYNTIPKFSLATVQWTSWTLYYLIFLLYLHATGALFWYLAVFRAKSIEGAPTRLPISFYLFIPLHVALYGGAVYIGFIH